MTALSTATPDVVRAQAQDLAQSEADARALQGDLASVAQANATVQDLVAALREIQGSANPVLSAKRARVAALTQQRDQLLARRTS